MLKPIGRPRPQVIDRTVRGWKEEETLVGGSLTYLAHNGKPCGYRVINTLTGTIQYPKTASTNPHFVKKLADQLNAQYHTTAYSAITIKG